MRLGLICMAIVAPRVVLLCMAQAARCPAGALCRSYALLAAGGGTGRLPACVSRCNILGICTGWAAVDDAIRWAFGQEIYPTAS